MRGLLTAGALALALVSGQSAVAAEPPAAARPAVVVAPKPFTWSGAYIGINGGWGRGAMHLDSGPPPAPDVEGALIGGTIGANLQFKQGWVLGFEGDWDWSNINGNAHCTAPCSEKIDWLATIRGRIGFAHERLLFYSTVGLAFAPVTFAPTAQPGMTRTQPGVAAGLGLEAAFLNNWSIKGEWLYIGLETFNCPVANCTPARNVSFNANVFRVGLNRHF
jgi:outer membrane immunogenic protein